MNCKSNKTSNDLELADRINKFYKKQAVIIIRDNTNYFTSNPQTVKPYQK